MLSLNSNINFDYANPNSEASTDARKDLAHLDYSPVKRITGRTFFMGMLVSMGGFIFGYAPPIDTTVAHFFPHGFALTFYFH